MTAGLSAGELHGLVDGVLEPERRADILRRLASSPADRARVEAWQEQNDIIRNAFGKIEKEPLPAALNLAPLFQTDAGPESGSSGPGRAGVVITAAVIVLLACGGGWMTWSAFSSNADPSEAPVRGTSDAILAGRATLALADETPSPNRLKVSRRDDGTTFRIPDLSAYGFSLVNAEASATRAGALVLHYRNDLTEHLVISVAQAEGESELAPQQIGATYSWHHHDRAFAIAGTVRRERLHDIAVLLQGEVERD